MKLYVLTLNFRVSVFKVHNQNEYTAVLWIAHHCLAGGESAVVCLTTETMISLYKIDLRYVGTVKRVQNTTFSDTWERVKA